MALKQHRLAQQYTYRRKIYVGKMKKQGNEGQGIMAHMVYYMSESRLRGKIRRINDALEADPVDIQTLKDLAISADGLISSDLRRQVWPKLLSVNLLEISSDQDKKKEIAELKQFHLHKYWRQVNLDVDRSHRRFPPDMRVSTRRAFQRQLVKVIMRVLCKNQDLHYYQGYHDVAVTVLLVAGEDLATAILDQLSLHQLSDFMDGTMEKTNRMLAFLHPIIEKADPELQDYLIRSEVGQVFALSWLITWFGHVLNDFNTILRLFDFFLATHPLMPVYFGAALVIRRRAAVLGGECEMSYVHHLLSWIPDDLPDYVEELVTSANSLFSKYPPEKLTAAADQYFKDSLAMANYREICRNLENQRPDSVLRQRRKELAAWTWPLTSTIADMLRLKELTLF